MKRLWILGIGFVFIFVTLFIWCILVLKQEVSMKTYAFHSTQELDISPMSSPDAPLRLVPQDSIYITFAGDTMFDGSVRTAIQQHGYDYPFRYVRKEVGKVDYAILNLETAVTTEKEKDTVQLYNFKAAPQALAGIKNAGFDMVTLANNHAMDYKDDGFIDTLNYLKHYELNYFGAGMNKEKAYQAQKVKIKGRTIKFLGFSRFLPAVRWYEGEGPVIASAYQQDRVLNTIQRESKNTDYLFVYIHWGVEGNVRPEAWQREFARKMIDKGADGIIGSHPHVLQGFEYYQNKPIAYSLGNFLFPDYIQGKTAETGLLTLKIEGDVLTMKFSPYYIRSNQIHSISSKEEIRILQKLEKLSYQVTREGHYLFSSQPDS
ncbi:poly-gamma-glutamate synthesis protein (capsule biosynthesis protein) [Salinibacillus kushneri]|uniref:Poly-gamma-glutamate synthesis protein (Capsule biosynthesis protein) n=1 Tax=Salinibacillus kushneri TaxID=237682 RepID=A0A1I0I8R9_9BACI|nr:CapA family protein [Salinibacillus kushneri]SET93154.1 poly-gamma-glutamate synthesis protein (capsule biosynthesis protein) [Salinibacillus kushneri]